MVCGISAVRWSAGFEPVLLKIQVMLDVAQGRRTPEACKASAGR